MKIRLIEHNETNLLDKCEAIANQDFIENSILLGDLHLPCIKLTEIFGLFNKNELLSFFVKFNGFLHPSIVFPYNIKPTFFEKMMIYLQKIVPKNFSIVSFNLTKNIIGKYFQINDYSSEYCMIINKKNMPTEIKSPFLKKAQKKDFKLIDVFYKSINAYPWNPIQLDSGFYFYIEINNQIIACGGSHFETSKSAQLGNIYVLEKYRGLQYGKIITTAITREILARKDFATLFVIQNNIPAISLYYKLGFKIHKPVVFFFCEKYNNLN